jgi:hypothetical protein
MVIDMTTKHRVFDIPDVARRLTERVSALEHLIIEVYVCGDQLGLPEKLQENIRAAVRGEPLPHASVFVYSSTPSRYRGARHEYIRVFMKDSEQFLFSKQDTTA